MSAFAEHFFGGGADHCAGCLKLDRPCARGLPGRDGSFCPRFVNDPQTPEGRAALRLALSPGIWVRAGMEGVVSGVNWAAAQALGAGVALGLEWPPVSRLLARFETGALVGAARRRNKYKEDE